MAKGQHGRREPVSFDLYGCRVEITWRKRRWRGRVLGEQNREIYSAASTCKGYLLGHLRVWATMASSGSDGAAVLSRDDNVLGGWNGL